MADGEDGQAAAEYIYGMAKELAAIAATADLDFLAYLLAMVEQEALRASKGSTRAPGAARG
jgi:hypothetical protein